MNRTRLYLALTALAVAATMGFADRVLAVDALGLVPPAETMLMEKPAPDVLSRSVNLAIDDVPTFTLGPMDVNALLEEDRTAEDKRLRTGVSRDLVVRMEQGRWIQAPGRGWLWTAELVSEGAIFMRAHFDFMQLPPGAQLMVYAPDDPTVVAGPFEGRGPGNDGEIWTRPLLGSRLRVEYFVPDASSATAPTGQPFQLDRVMHVYRDLYALVHQQHPDHIKEGPCHNDVTCFPAWANVARACAGLDFVGGAVSLYCSGQMLNSQAGDFTPYFLTANHCLSTAGNATSTAIIWLFQTATCNGAPPGIGTVPSSAVCTLLSTGAPSDYTLLMVEGTIPRSSLYWAGWTSGAIADGSACTAIHHPDGAYKRISFGTKASNPTCFAANHVRANWTPTTGGVTEPGSSGSGLFLDATQQLFGQLHCGPSACGVPVGSLNDSYGSFSVTYPNISALLAAGSDDNHENNDVCANAVTVPDGNYTSRIVKWFDEDWYRIPLAAGAAVNITLTLTHANGDIDITLERGCGGPVVAFSNSTTNTETINYTNTTGFGTNFYLRIYLFSDTRNGYTLNISGQSPNLNNTVTYAGWSSPVVPRNLNDATGVSAVLTPTLDGNAANTYLNWSVRQEGPNNSPQFSTESLLDGIQITPTYFSPNPAPPLDYYAINDGPYTVRGGRHTITSQTDAPGLIAESNEGDNSYSGQWVWSPLVTVSASPLVRVIPPNPGAFPNPNTDGFSYTRVGPYAWVTGIAMLNLFDDYDLIVYDDYASSSSGFSNFIGGSAYGSNLTDFVVGHYDLTPTTVYSGVYTFNPGGGGGNYAVDQNQASAARNAVGNGSFLNQPFAANRIVDVYEGFFTAGSTYYFTLRRLTGSSDIAFGVYPGSAGGIYGRSSGSLSAPQSPTLDVLTFSVAANGWHPVVVYRETGSGAGTSLTYDLIWNSAGFVDVPTGGDAPAALAFLGAKPNPLTESSNLEFALPDAGHVRLGLFDLNGRQVRHLVDGQFGAGRHSAIWDGRGDDGSRVGAGIYWARFEAAGKKLTRRVTVLN